MTYTNQIAFGVLIFTTVFGFTSLMDGYRWAVPFELLRGIVGLMFSANVMLWEMNYYLGLGLSLYFTLSLSACLWTYSSLPKRIEIATA